VLLRQRYGELIDAWMCTAVLPAAQQRELLEALRAD